MADKDRKLDSHHRLFFLPSAIFLLPAVYCLLLTVSLAFPSRFAVQRRRVTLKYFARGAHPGSGFHARSLRPVTTPGASSEFVRLHNKKFVRSRRWDFKELLT